MQSRERTAGRGKNSSGCGVGPDYRPSGEHLDKLSAKTSRGADFDAQGGDRKSSVGLLGKKSKGRARSRATSLALPANPPLLARDGTLMYTTPRCLFSRSVGLPLSK